MSAVLAEQLRSKAKDKAEKLSRSPKGDVDSSGWREPGGEDGEIQTGMRVLSRKNYASGGKVHGAPVAMHAGRKPRASGGLTATSLINRDVKSANEERAGTKHDGGLKKGGRVHKMLGGGMIHRPALGPVRVGNAGPGIGTHPGMGKPLGRPYASGGATAHSGDCKCSKCSGGRVARASGGKIPDGTRPEGGRIAKAKGGSAKKGMNVNIVIAPQGGQARPPMPMAAPPGGPVGMHQGAPPPMPPPGAAPPMGPPPMMRKAGGRVENVPANKLGKYPIKDGAGGGRGRREKARAYG